MARQAPHQAAGPFAGRRNMAVLAAAVAAVLVLVAVVAHVRAGHRSELLQSAAGRQRRIEALDELGVGMRRELVNAERKAFFYGFRAGEENAEKNVMEDEEASMEAVKLANLRKALLHQRQEVSEEQAVEAKNYEAERKAVLTAEHAKQMAEEKRAMLLSEKAADYARAWSLAAERQAEAAVLRKEAAEARLQQKHAAATEGEDAWAKPGSVRASELLSFCAQEFGDDQALQKFCYDKLISKPTTLDAPKRPQEVLKEQVIDAPTIQDAMIKAEREGLDTPPQYAELANGELYRVLPLKQALKQHIAKEKAPVHVHDAVHPVGKDGVEVDAPTLGASVAEAHKMGFKGSPEAVVYHPADGRPVVYKLENAQESQKLMQVAHAHGKPNDIEVDARTLAGSISRAHKMGLKGHPEAIVYHEANGKTELYEATSERPSQLRPEESQQQQQLLQRHAAAKPVAPVAAPRRQVMAEVKPTKSGEVEVEAQTLKQSLAEAHKMGFKGHPQAIVYHPAHGASETYVLQTKK